MAASVPDRPTLDGLEARWSAAWEAAGTYRFDRSAPADGIYAIDTPPPTVSGSLHIGHCFSYAHTDFTARFRRMRGREVFYPMGWDDNGLPTERRVQLAYGVRCDPSLPYEPGFRPPERPGAEPVPVSRPNFVELCAELTAADERAYEELWRRLGLSVDWSMTYTTIGERARRVSQAAFLRLLERGLAYQAEAPTLWDVDFQTAVAQAELEDRETPGAWYRLRFRLAAAGRDLEIDTTRPELVGACVAVVAHPSDERYAPLAGAEVLTPLYGARVPLVLHELADPEKGTGIAMICTFGDVTDVVWWRELGLPVRSLVERDGTIRRVSWGAPGWECDDAAVAQRAHDAITGMQVERARKRIGELLAEAGWLGAEPRSITHAVKFYEKGDRPLEIVTSRQWFVRTLPFREELLERGREVRWHPHFMGARYASWVEGLNSDWVVSRQRFFGVPFPVWYPVGEDGTVEHDRPITPPDDLLPVDPSTDVPPGHDPSARDRPGGFTGDPDVMDTWATSSLTPQIICGWLGDDDLFGRLYPMDLRPQAHEIIRTWLFYTVLRSHFEHGRLPWSDAAISGWIVDPERRKLSKSKGAGGPLDLLEEFGSDAVRYWAAGGRLGVDTTYDEGQMRVGRRLAIKILNASRFVLSFEARSGEITAPIDRSLVSELAAVAADATTAFEDYYDHTRALERTERFFWDFCDDYLELVKRRAYGEHGPESAASAVQTLRAALGVCLRLFAPVLPYVTEEAWSWWHDGSVHRAPWPDPAEVRALAEPGDPLVGRTVAVVLREIRRAKTEAKVSMRAPVELVVVRDLPERIDALWEAESELCDAGNVRGLDFTHASSFSVKVTLAEA